MTKTEILAFTGISRRCLFWRDPDPIPDNDYEIVEISVGEEYSLIAYNEGLSEATVPNNEIEIRNIYKIFDDGKV